MPWDYEIDPIHRIVLVRLFGLVTEADLLAGDDALRADPDFRADYDQLVDIGGATGSEVGRDGVGLLTDRPPLFSRTSRRAVIAPSDLAFGMSRMFELRRGSEAGEIRTFRSRQEAERWLEEAR